MSKLYYGVKRFIDIILSSLGLIILSPLFLIIGILIKLDSDGKYLGTEDFITGWYEARPGVKGPDGALGRPVDVKFHDGALYVSDDKAGVIYKIEYGK